MPSVSGLSRQHRYEARQIVRSAALLTYRNRDSVHYTQGYRRWSGIDARLRSQHGDFPHYADCSAFATWCLWDGLTSMGATIDTVNGTAWRHGSTYTQMLRGKRVLLPVNYLTGDLVFYSNPAHVAILVDPEARLVVSHGQESGPHLLEMRYRRVAQVRRYI